VAKFRLITFVSKGCFVAMFYKNVLPHFLLIFWGWNGTESTIAEAIIGLLILGHSVK
jgi:hypothetical protein